MVASTKNYYYLHTKELSSKNRREKVPLGMEEVSEVETSPCLARKNDLLVSELRFIITKCY